MPKDTAMILFWRSIIHSAKLGQMHAAIKIMADDNHVSQFSQGDAKMVFGK